jgi:hypothetical protein
MKNSHLADEQHHRGRVLEGNVNPLAPKYTTRNHQRAVVQPKGLKSFEKHLRGFVRKNVVPRSWTVIWQRCRPTSRQLAQLTAEALVAPGPRVTMATPGVPFIFPSCARTDDEPPKSRDTTK